MKHGSAGEEQDPDAASSGESASLDGDAGSPPTGASRPGLAQTGHAARTSTVADAPGEAPKPTADAPAPQAAEPKKLTADASEIPSDAYVVSLPMFEGPLDLLLSIIQKHELDILDIPVSFITEKYLEYLDVMRTLSIDVASEYLVMAATLTHIKSKMLLPEPPKDQEGEGAEAEEEDPRAELVRRLLEYQKYKAAAEALGSRDTLGSAVFARGGSEPVPEGPAPFAPAGTFDLLDAFAKLLARTKTKIDHEVVFDRISISDRISELVDILRPRRSMPFEELFPQQASRFDLIITFLAVLEMARLKMMRVFQTESLSPIHVELIVVDDEVEDPLGMRQSKPPAVPPAEEPPAEEPPAEEASAETPPAQEASAEEPPAEEVSTAEPPADEVSAEEPSAEEPPAEEASAEEPPAEEASAEEPPAEEMFAEASSADVPAAGEPSAEPSAEPPQAPPPVEDAENQAAEEPSEPPLAIDEPPDDEPPAEEPTAEEPPADAPPAEEPPAEEPPAEDPNSR